MYANIISALSTGLTDASKLIMVIGGVMFFFNLPDHNGPGMRNALLIVAGGAGMLAMVALL